MGSKVGHWVALAIVAMLESNVKSVVLLRPIESRYLLEVEKVDRSLVKYQAYLIVSNARGLSKTFTYITQRTSPPRKTVRLATFHSKKRYQFYAAMNLSARKKKKINHKKAKIIDKQNAQNCHARGNAQNTGPPGL
jgi:hypothetical protein